MKLTKHAILVAFLFSSTTIGPGARADIPVVDTQANTSLAAQLANEVKQLAALAQQVTALTNLVSLATVASTVLGDSVDPAMGQLFSNLQGAFGSSMTAYGSIMAVPAKIDAQLALFQPPPAGWESMSFPQLVARAQALQRLTLGTNSSAVAAQAAMIQRQADIAALQARANSMSDGAISALSATQAVAQQGRVSAQILQNIEQANEQIATIIAEKASHDAAMHDIGLSMATADAAARHEQADGAAGVMDASPLHWGE